jgi:hypothetical protein
VYSISGPYTADITAVRYWNGTSFASTCGADGGVQRVSLRVQSSDHQVTETLDVIIRLPCRPIGNFPLDQPCS